MAVGVDSVLVEVVVVDTEGIKVGVEGKGVERELLAGMCTVTSTCVPQPFSDSACTDTM